MQAMVKFAQTNINYRMQIIRTIGLLASIFLVCPSFAWCGAERVSDYDNFNGDWKQIYKGNLILQLSNESPNVDPVDMAVYLDGKLVLQKPIPYLSGRHIEELTLNVKPGKHKVSIKSKNGEAEISRTIFVKDQIFVAALYRHFNGSDLYPPAKRHIEFRISSTPMPQE